MSKNSNSSIFPTRRAWTQHPLWHSVIAILATVLPIALVLALAEAVVPKVWRTAWPTLLAAGFCVWGYCEYVRRIERREPVELAVARSIREFLHGLGIGLVLVISTLALLSVTDIFHVDGYNGWTAALKPLPEMVLVAIFEEILFRAILFRKTEAAWGSSIALCASAALFVLAHLPNAGISAMAVLITAVAATAFAAAYMLTRRLWLPIGMHFAWNACFESVVSLPVSGHATHGWLSAVLAGPEWLSGGAYGIEASAATLLAWLIASLALLWVVRKRGHWIARHRT